MKRLFKTRSYRQRNILSVASLLLCSVLIIGIRPTLHKPVAYFIVDPGNSMLFFEDLDLTIKGYDNYGVTYFFIPSYVELTSLDYTRSELKLYDNTGILLDHPSKNEILDVMVQSQDGTIIPYKIGFFCSSNLSTLYINTSQDIDDIQLREYSNASIEIVSPSGEITLLDAESEIKGRGNNTWTQCLKKPYEIKLSKKESICGISESKKWCLIANDIDPTKLLNKMVYDISSKMGMEYSIESEWVDVYANGLYMGNYLLCHEPTIGPNDLNIRNLEKENDLYFASAQPFETDSLRGYDYKSGPSNISGGYLIEKGDYQERIERCGFQIDNGDEYMIKSPDNISVAELEYIQSVFQNLNDSLSTENDLTELIDLDSFAKKHVIEEIIHNRDYNLASTYFYKKENSNLLYAGPCWDYDVSCGVGYSRETTAKTAQMQILHSLDYTYNQARESGWDQELIKNNDFQGAVKRVLYQYGYLFYNLTEEEIDRYYDKISDSIYMDKVRWEDDNENVDIYYFYNSIENNIKYLKYYLYYSTSECMDYWGIDIDKPYFQLGDGSAHTIKFKYPNGDVYELKKEDGAVIRYDELPYYDTKLYDMWRYEPNLFYFSSNLPVYEDLELTLIPDE